MLVPGKLLQPNLMFVGKAADYPRYSTVGRLLTLPANIRLAWKSLPGPNTRAFYKNSLIADNKVL